MTSEVVRTVSEENWLRVTAFLNGDRYDLGGRAAGEYPPELRLAGTPLLAPPAWRLPEPVPLDDIRLEFRPEQPPPDAPDLAALAPYALPVRADGSRYGRYTDVIAALAPPAVFENRPTYRLIEADLTAGDATAGAADDAGKDGPRLVFGRGRFFDGADAVGGADHEYAAAQLGMASGCPYRAALGGPVGLARRSAVMATSALTLRHDRRTGTATFPLHYRVPGKVSHAEGLYQVIPVGVFQPSGEAPWNEANDFSLWRGLLREYAEELLGADEDHGSERAPIDYQNWPLARAMTDGIAAGTVRAWCLGLGADPLTFALDLLAVVVIDAPLYDELFAGLVDDNAEGRVLKPRPFDAPSVTELLTGVPLQAAAAALLTLALSHRATLLAGLRERLRGYRAVGLSVPCRPCVDVGLVGVDLAVTHEPTRSVGPVRCQTGISPRQEVVGGTPSGSERLPAALAPLVQVRALRAERGVAAVSRVHPGRVGQPPEDLLRHALEQRLELRSVLPRVSHATGEYGRCSGVNTRPSVVRADSRRLRRALRGQARSSVTLRPSGVAVSLSSAGAWRRVFAGRRSNMAR